MDALEITKDGNLLTVEGAAPESDEQVVYLHKGISSRKFRREFTLADHVDVANATLELGMLNVRLVREVPEALKPKKIAINNKGVIEHKE
jgi:molecular chaperone IbpA